MDKKYKRLFVNTAWTLVGNTGSKLLTFLLLPLYTRWLGTEGYGLSDLLYTYSNLLLGLITLCTADGIFIFTKNKDKEEQQTFFSSTLFLNLGLFLIWGGVFYLSQYVTKSLSFNNAFTQYSWLIFVIVISTFIQNYTHQFVLSLDKIKIYSFTGIVLCTSTFILSWILIPIYGVIGYVYSLVSANLLTAIYSFVASKSYKYFNLSLDLGKIMDLLKYSIPLIPNTIMWWLVNALNRPIMESSLGLSEVGIFAVANKFPSVIMMLFAIFSVSWNISVFEEYHKPGYSSFYLKTFKILFLGISVSCIMLMAFSPIIIKLFAAEEFYEAWKYMDILIIANLFSCMSGFIGTNFGVVKESKYYFYSSIWGAVVSVLLNMILIPMIGLYGACISVAASFFIMAISRHIYGKKIVDAFLVKDIAVHSIIIIITCVLILIISNITIGICIAICSSSILLLIYKRQILPLYKMLSKKS